MMDEVIDMVTLPVNDADIKILKLRIKQLEQESKGDVTWDWKEDRARLVAWFVKGLVAVCNGTMDKDDAVMDWRKVLRDITPEPPKCKHEWRLVVDRANLGYWRKCGKCDMEETHVYLHGETYPKEAT